MDPRFVYADDPAKKKQKTGPQYIVGSEIKVHMPRDNPTSFEWGNTYEFPIGNSPFLISDKNHIELTLEFQKRKKGNNQATGKPYAWGACADDDLDNFKLGENFGSYCIEAVQMRQGLDVLETDAFVPRGRYLYELLALSHAGDMVKDFYTFAPTDTVKIMGLTKDDYKATLKETLKTKMATGLVVHVAPFCWPFQYRNRSTAHEVTFPNTGQELTIAIKLMSSPYHLYAADSTKDDEYKITVAGLSLVLAEPRFSAEGLRAITNRKLPPLRFDGNFVCQYSHNINTEMNDFHFTLQNIPMPNYMILQLFDPDYFTGKPTVPYAELIYLPKPLQMVDLVMKFGNKPLNYETANFSISQESSALLRQEIMRNSDIFDNAENNRKYYNKMPGYRQHHVLVSFCSDEVNQTLLRPMDATADSSVPQTLSVGLIGSNVTKIPAGKLLVTLIYKTMHLKYDVATGTFMRRDLKSLVIGS